MGCLNSQGQFNHWFGNIHLSGTCNRACYFCIGQHMMALDKFNVLDKFPLDGLDEFIAQCKQKNISEINVTGSNTDPLLYKHTTQLKKYLLDKIPGLIFKIRTNAVKSDLSLLKLYDGGSISICSFNPKIYKQMMGKGSPPRIEKIVRATKHWKDLKINIVLGEENVKTNDVYQTIQALMLLKIPKVNLREPYGQPHIGNPMKNAPQQFVSVKNIYGNPLYLLDETEVVYWDVHYTEVESINLYANGIVSSTYPVTKGHDPVSGNVIDQSKWTHGRHFKQWLK